MSSPSILSAVQKIRFLLTKEEKLKWVGIALFALSTSLLEVVTASVIVVFAQVLNQPDVGQKYLSMVGFSNGLAPGRIVLYIAIIVGIIYLVKNLVAAAEVFYQNFTIQKMNYLFKEKLLHRYAEADYGFYLTRNSSLGMTIVGGDVEAIFSAGVLSITSLFSEGMVFIFLVALVVFINPILALLIFGIAAILAPCLIKKLLPQFYLWGQKMQDAGLHSSKHLMQFFHGFKEVVLLGKQDFFVNFYQSYSRKQSLIRAILTATNAMPRLVFETLFVGLFVVAITFLCISHENFVQMLGVLGGYLYVGFRIMPGLNRIVSQLNILKSVIPNIERVHKEHSVLTKKENYTDLPNFSFSQTLELKDVCFHYLDIKKNALQNISFQIKKGECIGVVGETGSGKSTLIDVLLGLLKPQKGTILIDGKYPVGSYQWHQKIGYVPQSVYLTDDMIEANIAFGEKEIDEVRLETAINAAQLRKFIDQLPDGSKTFVGERGIRLSGGERQRISIARALYRNPEVLIFDEATSALDNETEEKLMETINEVSQNRTVIMIAHRLTTLKDCDRIVMMENGSVDQITTYEVLQKNKQVVA